jgi:YHS domain-containing protein
MKTRFTNQNLGFARNILILALVLIPLSAMAGPDSEPATYPLDKCIVSGETLGEHGEVVVKEYDGREVRFCCKMCVKDFEKDQATYLKKMDEAIIGAQLENYPAETCPISGQKLGAMGEPYNFVNEGHLVRLCCSGCLDQFNENPETAMAAVYAAEKVSKSGK